MSGAGDVPTDDRAPSAGGERMDTVEMTPHMTAAWRALRREMHDMGLVAKVDSFDCERLTITLVTKAGWTWDDVL